MSLRPVILVVLLKLVVDLRATAVLSSFAHLCGESERDGRGFVQLRKCVCAPSGTCEVTIPIDNVMHTAEGLIPAAYTPFDDEGKLNVSVIPEYAEYLKNNRIAGVLLAGTSGEGPSMSLDERKELLDAWLKESKPRGLKVMMQIGGQSLPQVLDLAKYSDRADAIVTLPELYYKPASDSDIVYYLKMVSEAAPNLPIIYYDHPAYSGVKIQVGKFFKEATSKIPNFKGMKCDFTCGLELMASAHLREDQRLFMSSYMTTSASVLMGFNSSMTAVIGIFPKLFLAIEEAISEGNVESARQLQLELNERVALIISHGSYVSSSKAAMEIVTGIRVGSTRDPMKRLSDEQRRLLQERLHTLKSSQ